MNSSKSLRHCGLNPQSRWYAARIISSAALFLKRLAYDGIHSYRTRFAPGGASQQGVGAEKSVVELNLVEVQAT